MSKQLIFMGTYQILPDNLEIFMAANEEMGDFVQEHEPQMISWQTFINDQKNEATTIMIFPNSTALEYHFEAANRRISHGQQVVKVQQVELFGDPGPRVLEALQAMSEKGGSWPVIVKNFLHGFPIPNNE
jgi:hypothetical protein